MNTNRESQKRSIHNSGNESASPDVTLETFVSPEPFSNQPFLNESSTYQMQADNLNMHEDGHTAMSPSYEKDLIRYNHISYVLYLLSFFTAGLTWIIPIFMNYYKRREAEGTWLETHFDWQIKTFWYSAIMGVFALFLVFFALGGMGVSLVAQSGNLAIGSSLLLVLAGLIFLIAIIWHLYRIIRGWIALSDGRPV